MGRSMEGDRTSLTKGKHEIMQVVKIETATSSKLNEATGTVGFLRTKTRGKKHEETTVVGGRKNYLHRELQQSTKQLAFSPIEGARLTNGVATLQNEKIDGVKRHPIFCPDT